MHNDLAWLNGRSPTDAENELLKCCGSRRWAVEVAKRRPFDSVMQLNQVANETWWSLDREDWLEAFRSHPKIGERKAEQQQTSEAQGWSAQEQSGGAKSSEETKARLTRLNREYETRFGYIFIVCATGKSSDEMLLILTQRLQNNPTDELRIAAGEQAKITELRLIKLLGP